MRRAVRSVAVLLCVLAAYVVLSDMKLTPRAAIRICLLYTSDAADEL